MNRQLWRFPHADGDMKCHPCDRKPPGPVPCKQQENAANNGERLGDFDPDPIGLPALGKVNDKTARTDRKIKAGNQDDRQRDLPEPRKNAWHT